MQAVVHFLLPALGTATAIIGGAGAWGQRHLKRLLAFSTVSHMGLLLIALALVTPLGLAGFCGYFVGHGLVKASLFMLAGICLANLGGADEIALRGKGREMKLAGLAGGLGGLLLAGLPVGIMSVGADYIDSAAGSAGHSWIKLGLILGNGLTGAAVLRASGRIFLGLGPEPGREGQAPSVPEAEPGNVRVG